MAALQAGEAYNASSLDAPASADGSAATVGDNLGGLDRRFEGVDNHEALKPLLAALPDREREILKLRFVDEFTKSQIAERIGVSQMHISRLLNQIVSRLRVGMLAD
ncbi:sigma-70 family RNA polymerase sigma factor [Cryptosporangium sp. NPDC051539]|uniref:sigma-70 family RNA polymerase sigma factor n=1 Tax=Cryptosporangium sp. NPDC051539 TaxID=3363962 RepID=UPI0037875662